MAFADCCCAYVGIIMYTQYEDLRMAIINGLLTLKNDSERRPENWWLEEV